MKGEAYLFPEKQRGEKERERREGVGGRGRRGGRERQEDGEWGWIGEDNGRAQGAHPSDRPSLSGADWGLPSSLREGFLREAATGPNTGLQDSPQGSVGSARPRARSS